MRAALVALCVLLPFAVVGNAATTGTDPPGTPTNLEVVEATETSITIAWGPSQPGEFLPGTVGKKNTVTIRWGPSEDSRSAVTYTLKKDGSTVASGLTSPSYTLSGVGPKVKSFRVCVTAFNAKGGASPETCGTYTRT